MKTRWFHQTERGLQSASEKLTGNLTVLPCHHQAYCSASDTDIVRIHRLLVTCWYKSSVYRLHSSWDIAYKFTFIQCTNTRLVLECCLWPVDPSITTNETYVATTQQKSKMSLLFTTKLLIYNPGRHSAAPQITQSSSDNHNRLWS